MAVCASILPHLGSLFFAFVLPMYCTLTLWYQQLYDALLKTFTPKEQWFVEYHYNQRYTLIALTQLNDIILLVCDGAAWHKSKALRCPENIQLLSIPPYTPEMNPVEQVWKQIRSMGFRNEAFNSLDDVMNRLCETICMVTNDMIKSITGRQDAGGSLIAF